MRKLIQRSLLTRRRFKLRDFFNRESNLSKANCIGWWEQNGLGRQPMRDLVVDFTHGVLSGEGTDIVGDFTLQGKLENEGQVRIVKQYIGRHQVIYIGQYDGEGTFFGTWLIGAIGGKWSIKIVVNRKASEDIEEILPLP